MIHFTSEAAPRQQWISILYKKGLKFIAVEEPFQELYVFLNDD